MAETLSSGSVKTRLQRIAQLARERPGMAFTSLSHVIDIYFLEQAHWRTRKDGAAGVDGQTAKQYGENLRANLGLLLDRFKSGTYQAPPVRRVYIPKEGGSRPIGVPTFEDKVLQRAVTMVLEARRSMSRTFGTARGAFGLAGRLTRRWRPCGRS